MHVLIFAVDRPSLSSDGQSTVNSTELTAFFSCHDGLKPCRDAVLRNLGSGAIPWQKTITHTVVASEAPALYDAINRNAIPEMMGAVIRWG